MSLGLLGALFFGGLVIFFFLLGKLTWGSGADLVDWDPVGHSERRMAADAEDIENLLALTNESRRAQGLPELEEHDVLRTLREEQRRGAPGRD